ncbi:MAG: VUT family protein [Cytophagales bacterium]|nr:MAG: VUT family protein [Cytophagales bacterium]
MSIEEITKRKNLIFIILSAFFITNAILAEIIGVKIFSLESTLSLAPAQINILGLYQLDFNLTAGVIIWPFVFLTTDLINEYFGKDGVRKITFITTGMIIYVFLIIWIATKVSPAKFWLEVNHLDLEGNPININTAYATIFQQGGGIIIGSITAFLVGQMLDVYVFHYIRKLTGQKYIWLRATGSTLVSQLIDSYLVLFVAFFLLGGANSWEIAMVFAVGSINYIYKFLVAISLTPLLYIIHRWIDQYLGKKVATKMIDVANEEF